MDSWERPSPLPFPWHYGMSPCCSSSVGASVSGPVLDRSGNATRDGKPIVHEKPDGLETSQDESHDHPHHACLCRRAARADDPQAGFFYPRRPEGGHDVAVYLPGRASTDLHAADQGTSLFLLGHPV